MSRHKKACDLKSIQALWYSKLKSEGFHDIESKDGELLNQWDSSYFQLRYDPESFAAKETYFYRARQFLNIHKFPHPIEKEIWRLHCEGLGVRQISIHVGDDPYLSLPLWCQTIGSTSNKDSVAEILKPLKKAFFIWMRTRSDDLEQE